MKGMAAINAGLAARDAVNAVSGMKQNVAAGIKVSVNVSHNESHADFTQSGTNTVAAGGDLRIEATGAGADSTLNVIGSDLNAGNNTLLKADGAIRLAAAENTAVQKSTDGSSGASVGIGFALLGDQNGFTIDLAASRTRSRADGSDSTWTNSHVTTGKTLTLVSGGDTTLQGAAVNAQRVESQIGGNLRIDSLQDKGTYDSKQESAGINLMPVHPAPLLRRLRLRRRIQLRHHAHQRQPALCGRAKRHLRRRRRLRILHPTFNAERTRREMAAQVQITQTFSQKAPKAVAELSDSIVNSAGQQIEQARTYLALWREREEGRLAEPEKVKALDELEQNRGFTPEAAVATLRDPDLRAQQELFAEGGAGRVVLHTLTGALGGGVQGALGAGGVAAAAPEIDEWQRSVVSTARGITSAVRRPRRGRR